MYDADWGWESNGGLDPRNHKESSAALRFYHVYIYIKYFGQKVQKGGSFSKLVYGTCGPIRAVKCGRRIERAR